MALVTRLTRLFQADFHAVLDRIEEPELQLRQAVREMQLALEQDRQRLQLIAHECGQLEQRCNTLGAQIDGFDEELDICLAEQQDDLARDLVRRKLAADRQIQADGERSAMLLAQREALSKQVDEQDQQLAAMQQKLELLASNDPARPATAFCDDAIRSEEVEIALLREKQRRAQS